MDLLSVIEDIAHGLAAEELTDLIGEAGDVAEAEDAALTLADRVRGSLGAHVLVHSGATPVDGRLVASGDDWLIVDSHLENVLIPLASIEMIDLGWRAEFETRRVPRSLQSVLRGVKDSPVDVWTRTTQMHGNLVRVGKDFLDIEPTFDGGWENEDGYRGRAPRHVAGGHGSPWESQTRSVALANVCALRVFK